MGLIFAGVGAGIVLQLLAGYPADRVYAGGAHPFPGALWLAWLSAWAAGPALFAMPTLVPLLFPDGRLPSRRWRAVAWLDAVVLAMVLVTGMLTRGPLEDPDWSVENPVGVLPRSDRLGSVLIIAAVVLSLAALVVRYRSSRGDERQQLKWLLTAGGFTAACWVSAAVIGAAGLHAASDTIFVIGILGLLGIPVATAFAVLRYRLYDVDELVGRTLIYGLSMGFVVLLDIAVVSTLGVVVSEGTTPYVSLLATGLLAISFLPLRRRVARMVNRLVYGERESRATVISTLAQRLGEAIAPDEVLPAVAETVQRALDARWVVVELGTAQAVLDSYAIGEPLGPRHDEVLRHAGAPVGRLAFGRPRELSESERRLVAEIARQAGVALHAVRLTAEVQRSREQLVETREEERRRVHRDLHDGLGPALAGMAMQLDLAARLTQVDPEAADAVLRAVRGEAQESIADIRRLVYDLRPPALDELGLIGAITQQATRFTTSTAPGGEPRPLLVEVDAVGDVGALPAAVEVAAYRIALEAMTNVARHAGATRCHVLLSLEDSLELEVTDDGLGLAGDAEAHVGLGSMRERARELGGVCLVERPPDGGTRVFARLPLPAPGRVTA
jgi:signal transduction histidine kinase